MIYLILFLTFFKIGALTFGGGYAMLPFIKEEVVKNAWATMEELIDFVAVSESTPGPFAINMATFIGSRQGGLLGSVSATLGVVLPSFIIILIVAKFFEKFKENRAVKAVMSGLKPAVVGLIASAFLSIFATVFFGDNSPSLSIFTQPDFFVSLGIFLICTLLAFKKAHPIAIIVLSAVVGILYGYLI
jgi:chromate transporter